MMTAMDYAIAIDRVNAQLDSLMIQITDLEKLRNYLLTQWNYQKKKESEHEQQLELAI